MLLFWSEEHIDKWCRDWNLPKGETVDLDKCCKLAYEWYGPDRREPEWRRRTVEEAEAVFAKLGFTSAFWSLSG